jgi:hypothetical protein
MSIRNATLALIVLVGASASASSVEAQYYDRWEIGYPHIEVGFDVGVMIWNGVDRDIVRPGGTVDVRFGWDYKWWVPMFALGFRGNGLDLYNVPGAPPGTRSETLTNIFFSLGVRFKSPNRSRVTPFLDGLFDMNWWHLNETQVVCSYYYCVGSNRYRFTPGFHGRVGIQIRVAPQAEIEVGFGAGYSFKGQFFLRNRSWLEPAIAFTYSVPAGYENRTSMPGYE